MMHSKRSELSGRLGLSLALSLAAMLTGTYELNAAEVPPQLHGKTITASYSGSQQAINDETGKAITAARSTAVTVYISNKGHIFLRRTAINNTNRAGKFESGPESTPFHFEGGALVARVSQLSGAVQVSIKFSPDFQSCTISVINGHTQGGQFKWRSDLNGKTYTSLSSAQFSDERCAIASGNGL
jgi:hypothetical protein